MVVILCLHKRFDQHTRYVSMQVDTDNLKMYLDFVQEKFPFHLISVILQAFKAMFVEIMGNICPLFLEQNKMELMQNILL